MKIKNYIFAIALSSIILSCEKENIKPTKQSANNYFITSSTKVEDCLEHNQNIVQSIIDSIGEYGSWRKSMAYYFHIKTRDSLSTIYNEKIAKTRVYESPQVFIEPSFWEDAKFDMLDSMKIVWKKKENIINAETQESIENEINKRKQSGEIWKCDEDTYDPKNGGTN